MADDLKLESYEVEIARNPLTNVAVSESWLQAGKLCRTDGPSFVRRDATTGIVILEVWRQNDILDRKDGPAIIRRKADTGRVYRTEWFENGEKLAPSRSSIRRWMSLAEGRSP